MNKIVEDVRQVAEGLGLSFMYETMARANVLMDKVRRRNGVVEWNGKALPICLYVQPVSGRIAYDEVGNRRDIPSCLMCFGEAMPLDYKGEEAEAIVERLKGYATEFIEGMNALGEYLPIGGDINYQVGFDRMDANLCILSMELTIEPLYGEC